MPGFDKTGPGGQGPRTGGGFGGCTVDPKFLEGLRKKGIGVRSPSQGLGGGRGRFGLGRGFGRRGGY